MEKLFVNSFVLKNKKERSLFELSSNKKRSNFFYKLCHGYNEVFDPKNLKKISEPNSDASAIYKLLVKHGAGKNGYVMSSFDDLDRKTLPLLKALEQCVGRGLPSIVICASGKLAYFEAEQEAGPPPRFILKKR